MRGIEAEVFNGVSNSRFKTIEISSAIDNEKYWVRKKAMSAEMDPRRSGEQFISQM